MASERLAAFVHRQREPVPDLSTLAPETWAPEALAAARLVWQRRIVNETGSIEIGLRLRQIAARLGGLGAEVEAALARLEDDERMHAELATRFVRALQAEPAPVAPLPPMPDESASASFLRLTLTGLAVCETVSAARYAAVRTHTDLPLPRACIELFLRDETAHSALGFALVPLALERLAADVGDSAARRLAGEELRGTFRHLDLAVGMDAERRGGLPPIRPQPAQNPGVVEPSIDAAAFYSAIECTIVPKLEALGLPAESLWNTRWS